ncbi:MAG: YybH family protein [Candidatus Acidiferrales bacterium]
MNTHYRPKSMAALLSLVLALLLAGGNRAAAQTVTHSSDEQHLHQLLKTYVKAVDTLDLRLVARIWSHDPGVSFIQPRGTENGFEQIRDDFYIKTMGVFSQRDLTMENPVFHVYGDTAWSQMTWTFHATLKEGGQKITTTGRETQIYRKENGVWRIVHDHYSGPPVTGARKGF